MSGWHEAEYPPVRRERRGGYIPTDRDGGHKQTALNKLRRKLEADWERMLSAEYAEWQERSDLSRGDRMALLGFMRIMTYRRPTAMEKSLRTFFDLKAEFERRDRGEEARDLRDLM